MEQLSMCRICLASDVRLFSLSRHLQDMYEKLTSMTFKRELAACYICLARLRNCYRLQMSCLQSEELLTKMQNSCVSIPKVFSTNTLGVSSTLTFSLGVLKIKEECHIKEDWPEVIHDTKLDQQNIEGHGIPETEETKLTVPHSSMVGHLQESLDAMKSEPDNVETGHGIPSNSKTEETKLLVPHSSMVTHLEDSLDAMKSEQDDDENDSETESQDEFDVPTDGELHCFYLDNPIDVMKRDPEAIATGSGIKKLTETESLLIMKPDNENKNITDKLIGINNKHKTIDKFKHVCKHTVDKPYMCDFCKKCFAEERSLVVHIRTHTGYKPYKCDVCGLGYTTSRILRQHKRKHTVDKQTVDKHTVDKQYICDVCNKCFSSPSILAIHSRKHTGDKPFMCDVCKKCFAEKRYLVEHIRTHSGYKPYIDVCGIGYTHSRILTPRERKHTGDKPHMCDVCKKCFHRVIDLKKHRSRRHPEAKSYPYNCDGCKKRFTSKFSMEQHTCKHTIEKPYMCDVCNKSFSKPSILAIHSRSHTGDKPFMCDVCKKCFVTKGALIKHIRTHTGVKPFKCEVCKKYFTQLFNLKVHSTRHSGKKPYKCDFCQKYFHAELYLNKHIQNVHR